MFQLARVLRSDSDAPDPEAVDDFLHYIDRFYDDTATLAKQWSA